MTKHEFAVKLKDRYIKFADIFLSTRHIILSELNLKEQLLRHSDTVNRQVLNLLVQ